MDDENIQQEDYAMPSSIFHITICQLKALLHTYRLLFSMFWI